MVYFCSCIVVSYEWFHGNLSGGIYLVYNIDIVIVMNSDNSDNKIDEIEGVKSVDQELLKLLFSTDYAALRLAELCNYSKAGILNRLDFLEELDLVEFSWKNMIGGRAKIWTCTPRGKQYYNEFGRTPEWGLKFNLSDMVDVVDTVEDLQIEVNEFNSDLNALGNRVDNRVTRSTFQRYRSKLEDSKNMLDRFYRLDERFENLEDRTDGSISHIVEENRKLRDRIEMLKKVSQVSNDKHDVLNSRIDELNFDLEDRLKVVSENIEELKEISEESPSDVSIFSRIHSYFSTLF